MNNLMRNCDELTAQFMKLPTNRAADKDEILTKCITFADSSVFFFYLRRLLFSVCV